MKIVLITGSVVIVVALAVFLFVLRGALAAGRQEPAAAAAGTLWDLSTTGLDGEPADLSAYAGRVVLVVNVASKCGLTPQYKGLQALYTELAEQGFVILGFPANDFMGQEPGTAQEIRTFCDTEYGVTFPLMAKVKVKGDDKDAIYRWLTAGGLEEPTWNFTKYLVGRDGKVIARFGPRTAPDDAGMRAAIEAALVAAEG